MSDNREPENQLTTRQSRLFGFAFVLFWEHKVQWEKKELLIPISEPHVLDNVIHLLVHIHCMSNKFFYNVSVSLPL